MLGSSPRGLKSYSWMTARSASPSFSAGSASSGSSSESRTSAPGWRAAKVAIARGTSVAAAVGKAARRTLPRTSPCRRQLGLGRLELGQHALGAPDEQPRGGGEDHAAPLALEQRDPDLALERGEVLGDRGGRVAERLGRGGDGAALGELAQHVQAADVEHCEAELTLTMAIRKWT